MAQTVQCVFLHPEVASIESAVNELRTAYKHATENNKPEAAARIAVAGTILKRFHAAFRRQGKQAYMATIDLSLARDARLALKYLTTQMRKTARKLPSEDGKRKELETKLLYFYPICARLCW